MTPTEAELRQEFIPNGGREGTHWQLSYSCLQRGEYMTLTRRGPAFITAIGLLLAIAGALAPKVESGAAGTLPARLVVPLSNWLIAATVAALAAASLVLIATLFSGPRRRRKKGEQEYEMYYEPRKAPLSVALLLLALALTPPGILAASILWLDRNEVLLHGRPGGPATAAGLPKPSVRSSAREEAPARMASPVTADLLGALALLGGFASLAVMLWLGFGDRLWRPAFEDERPRAALGEAVEESFEDLRLEPDARAAIIKCYRRFEHAVAAVRLPRPPWQTPIEFMRAALGRLPLPPDAVARLTALFEIARFSQHAVGSAERENALRSLAEIRTALDRAKDKPDATPA
jgi:Domain of unknown function (DUF4129)